MNKIKKVKQGQFLWLLMEQRGMNQADLAELLGVHPSHISMYFAKKRRLGIEKAKVVANHFSIPLEYLYQ